MWCVVCKSSTTGSICVSVFLFKICAKRCVRKLSLTCYSVLCRMRDVTQVIDDLR